MTTIYGTVADDYRTGTSSADVFYTYQGNDTMVGGLGNDSYTVETNRDAHTSDHIIFPLYISQIFILISIISYERSVVLGDVMLS